LVTGESSTDTVESRSTLATGPTEAVAVAALFALYYHRALQFFLQLG
jgi:hypothetical protein